MKKSLNIIFLILLISSCEEQVSKEFHNDSGLRIVADAIITNVPGENYVRLSRQTANPDEVPETVSGALVLVTDGNRIEVFIEGSMEKGTYRPDPSIRAVSGKVYGILIRVGNNSDTAITSLEPVSPLSEFKTTPDESKPGHYFISGENNGDPAMIRYLIDTVNCIPEGSCRVEQYEYILSSFDVAQIFSPKKETLSFPSGTRVIRKKYSLNSEYEAYIRAVLSETEWRGGLFDVEAGTPKGNFRNNTLGFFAGCSLVMDTVYIK
jgi:hypothetical protein